MRGPDDRGARGALALAADRRRRKHLEALRRIAIAECHRDRAHASMTKAESIVAYGIGAGFDMTTEVEQLDGLRETLASAESNIAAARQLAGLADAT